MSIAVAQSLEHLTTYHDIVSYRCHREKETENKVVNEYSLKTCLKQYYPLGALFGINKLLMRHANENSDARYFYKNVRPSTKDFT